MCDVYISTYIYTYTFSPQRLAGKRLEQTDQNVSPAPSPSLARWTQPTLPCPAPGLLPPASSPRPPLPSSLRLSTCFSTRSGILFNGLNTSFTRPKLSMHLQMHICPKQHTDNLNNLSCIQLAAMLCQNMSGLCSRFLAEIFLFLQALSSSRIMGRSESPPLQTHRTLVQTKTFSQRCSHRTLQTQGAERGSHKVTYLLTKHCQSAEHCKPKVNLHAPNQVTKVQMLPSDSS